MKLSSDPKQHEIEALLPAYVLGALPADEMHSVENYIHQQRNFLAQVQKFEERSALLTHIAKPVTPPANVRRTIIMIARLDAPAEAVSALAVGGTAIQPFGSNGTHNGSNGHAKSHNNGYSNGHSNGSNGQNGSESVTYAITPYRPQAAATRQTSPIAIQSRQRRLTLRLWQVAATTALLALITVAVLGLLLNRQLNSALAETDSAQGKVNTLLTTNNQLLVEKETLNSQNQQLVNEQQALAQQLTVAQQQLATISSAEKATALRGVDGSPAQAMVYSTRNGFVITATGLAELLPDRTYQLWLLDSLGVAKPIAVFTVQPNETNLWREFSLPLSQLNYSEIGLSIEQIGGSATPGRIIMRGAR